MWVTNHFVNGLRTPLQEGIHSCFCKPGHESWLMMEAIGPRGESSTYGLLNGHSIKTTPTDLDYACRLGHFSAFITEASICNRW